jgi:glycine betaine/choline ABC-type transport system substrate-binding protein
LWGDFVEKVEKSSLTKTRQIAIRWNIAAQHHLRPVADLARCLIDKLAGPPADFLNAAPIGLPENRTSPKGSFSTLGNGGGSSPEAG